MPDVNITKLPNFDAVRGHLRVDQQGVQAWIDKLEEWCKLSLADRESLQGEVEGAERKLTNAEAAADTLRDLEQRLADTERGIFTVDETLDWLRRELR